MIAWLAAALAAASLAAERSFFGDVGEDGVLQESFFLPLGIGLFVIAALAFAYALFLMFRDGK